MTELLVSCFNAFIERPGDTHDLEGIHTGSVILFRDEIGFDNEGFLWHMVKLLSEKGIITPTVGSYEG